MNFSSTAIPQLVVVDMFCGAGGITTGLTQACRELGIQPKIIAINHWNVAIETHRRNHPEATHWCERVDSLDPRRLTPDGRIDFLIAAPECTHHSVARGGKPFNDQSRASAWQVIRYAEALNPRHILLENVREFTNWGPLCANNKRRLKSRRGQTFAAFLGALESLGYTVEWKILNAADYGEATTRERLFIQAKRGRGVIAWPAPTHSRCADQPDLFGNCLKPWRPAREIIDWSIPSKSIFSRKKPLAPAKSRRSRPVDSVLPTATRSNSHGVVEPFIVPFFGERPGQDPRIHSLGEPLPTATTDGAGALVKPRLSELAENSAEVSVTGGIVQSFLCKYNRTATTGHSVDEPLDTVTTKDRFGLILATAQGKFRLDIRFRMLQPSELAPAMGFDEYEFTGNREERVKQIGNAVSVRTARALCLAILPRFLKCLHPTDEEMVA